MKLVYGHALNDGEMGPYPLSDSNLPPDGEMGPYPLSDSNLAPDGEMGPYPLSDNSNLLGSSGVMTNLPMYRNYGSNYSTQFGSQYSNHNNHTTQSGSNNCSSNIKITRASSHSHGYHQQNRQCRRQRDRENDQAVQYGTNSPVPIRKSQTRWDSFRRHSAHGRISSPTGISL